MFDMNVVAVSGRVAKLNSMAGKNGKVVVLGSLAIKMAGPKDENGKTTVATQFVDFVAFGPIAARMLKLKNLIGAHVLINGLLNVRLNENKEKGVTFKNTTVQVHDFAVDAYAKEKPVEKPVELN